MRIVPSFKERKLVITRKNRYLSLSPYGKIQVLDTVEAGVPVRLLLVNGTRESATYLIPGLYNEPVFEYIRAMTRITDGFRPLRRVLMIGGAGFSLPKHFISRYPEMSMDVIENNPEMLTIAHEYFFLDELYEAYGLHGNGRLNVVLEDGFQYLEKTAQRYDLIINDAFVGRVADRELSSDAGCRLIHDHLNEGGMYLINLITARSGVQSMNGVMAEAILSRVFGMAAMIPVYPDYDANSRQNVIVRAVKKSGATPDGPEEQTESYGCTH